jgi:UDPglucose 6-dehydrogenase
MASKEVGKSLTGYTIIVNKSTVPIGSHQVVAGWISSYTEHPFDVVSNPEFLKEGSAVTDFLYPERVVIGTDKEEVFKKMSSLYSSLIGHDLILHMDPISSEMTKYACNAFLATRISFMNELALLAEKVGGNIDQIRKGMGTDGRIGHHFLYAGVGYGGSCFPKDVRALLSTAKSKGVRLGIVEAAEAANWGQKRHLGNLIRAKFGEDLAGKTFGIWGLAFKPNTDDMREAPSLAIIGMLLQSRAKVQVYDPVASQKAKETLGNTVQYCNGPYEAAKGTDAILLVTEWNEFRQIDFMRVKELVKQTILFDGRNLYDPAELKALGFSYMGIGRGN